VKTCAACGKALERKPHETKGNFDKRATCDRKCQAHNRHGTNYKLKEKKRLTSRGSVPLRVAEPLRSLLITALIENPELGVFIFEAVAPQGSRIRSDVLSDYGVG
jgi:hypothetical protein